jgi:hypothetical protein
LEQDARKRISAVVCDAVSSGFTSAHSGGQEREDFF